MPAIPAICVECSTVFPSGFWMEGGSAHMVGNKSGPCPNCGAMGSIPGGFYDFIGQTLRIVSNWSPERRQHLASEIASARKAADPRAAVEATIESEPDLRALAQTLLIPRDPGQFWAFIAALVAIIALLASGPTVNEQTVIEKVITQPTPTTQPAPTAPQAVPKKKPPPPPAKAERSKHKAKQHKRRK